MRHHLVADANAVDSLAYRPDDARCVAAADVEVLCFSRFASRRDDIDGAPERTQSDVAVDAPRHDIDKDLSWARPWRRHGLDRERGPRVPVSLGADQLGVHPRRDVTRARHRADLGQLQDGHAASDDTRAVEPGETPGP